MCAPLIVAIDEYAHNALAAFPLATTLAPALVIIDTPWRLPTLAGGLPISADRLLTARTFSDRSTVAQATVEAFATVEDFATTKRGTSTHMAMFNDPFGLIVRDFNVVERASYLINYDHSWIMVGPPNLI